MIRIELHFVPILKWSIDGKRPSQIILINYLMMIIKNMKHLTILILANLLIYTSSVELHEQDNIFVPEQTNDGDDAGGDAKNPEDASKELLDPSDAPD